MDSDSPTSESPRENARAEPVGMRVIEAIAEREDVDPVDLDAPLNDAIDPDALDSLFSPSDRRTGGRVEFAYCGYTVVVRGTGEVTVEEPSVASASANPPVTGTMDD